MDRRHARSMLRHLCRMGARSEGLGRQAVRRSARSMAVGGRMWNRSAYNAIHPCGRIPCICDQEEEP